VPAPEAAAGGVKDVVDPAASSGTGGGGGGESAVSGAGNEDADGEVGL